MRRRVAAATVRAQRHAVTSLSLELGAAAQLTRFAPHARTERGARTPLAAAESSAQIGTYALGGVRRTERRLKAAVAARASAILCARPRRSSDLQRGLPVRRGPARWLP